MDWFATGMVVKCNRFTPACLFVAQANEFPSLGSTVTVVSDAAILESECRASGMGWPLGPGGVPRVTKLGSTGIVSSVDLSDGTADLGGGVGWVPIGALVGHQRPPHL